MVTVTPRLPTFWRGWGTVTNRSFSSAVRMTLSRCVLSSVFLPFFLMSSFFVFGAILSTARFNVSTHSAIFFRNRFSYTRLAVRIRCFSSSSVRSSCYPITPSCIVTKVRKLHFEITCGDRNRMSIFTRVRRLNSTTSEISKWPYMIRQWL